MTALRQEMHRSPASLAAGLDCWLHKSAEDLGQMSAEAAALTVAELLTLAGNHLTGGKWRG